MQKLQKNNLIAQGNSLIESRYSITKNEQILLFAMISLINPKDKEFLTFSFTINELSKILNIHRATALREFDKITDRLMSRVIRLQKSNGWDKLHWVSHASVRDNRVSLRFHDDLKPYLLELKKSGNFTQYRLGIAVHFRSVYSIRIYQLLREYYSKKIYEFTFSLEDLRAMLLGEKSTSYPLFKDFKKKVLNVAQRELREKDKETKIFKSDLNFDLQTRRTGRKISHLIFIIKTQQTKPIQVPSIIGKTTTNKHSPQIIQDYEAIGVMQTTVQPYLDQRGEQALIKTLNKFHDDKENGKINKSEQGYLAHLLKTNAGQETTQKQQRQQATKNKALEKQKAAEEKQLKEKFLQERNVAVDGFFASLRFKDRQILMGDFEASTQFAQMTKNSIFLLNLYENTGVEDDVIKKCFENFVIDQHLDGALNDFQQWKEKQC